MPSPINLSDVYRRHHTLPILPLPTKHHHHHQPRHHLRAPTQLPLQHRPRLSHRSRVDHLSTVSRTVSVGRRATAAAGHDLAGAVLLLLSVSTIWVWLWCLDLRRILNVVFDGVGLCNCSRVCKADLVLDVASSISHRSKSIHTGRGSRIAHRQAALPAAQILHRQPISTATTHQLSRHQPTMNASGDSQPPTLPKPPARALPHFKSTLIHLPHSQHPFHTLILPPDTIRSRAPKRPPLRPNQPPPNHRPTHQTSPP